MLVAGQQLHRRINSAIIDLRQRIKDDREDTEYHNSNVAAGCYRDLPVGLAASLAAVMPFLPLMLGICLPEPEKIWAVQR